MMKQRAGTQKVNLTLNKELINHFFFSSLFCFRLWINAMITPITQVAIIDAPKPLYIAKTETELMMMTERKAKTMPNTDDC